jgi:hypothetical protein
VLSAKANTLGIVWYDMYFTMKPLDVRHVVKEARARGLRIPPRTLTMWGPSTKWDTVCNFVQAEWPTPQPTYDVTIRNVGQRSATLLAVAIQPLGCETGAAGGGGSTIGVAGGAPVRLDLKAEADTLARFVAPIAVEPQDTARVQMALNYDGSCGADSLSEIFFRLGLTYFDGEGTRSLLIGHFSFRNDVRDGRNPHNSPEFVMGE